MSLVSLVPRYLAATRACPRELKELIVSNIQPAPPHTIGNAITEAEAAMRERLAVLEAAAVKDEQSVIGWVKSNWLHIANAGGIAAAVLKLFGKL